MEIHGRHYIAPWDRVTISLPFSEVNMHMHVAGERMDVQLIETPGHHFMAQIYKDGRRFSAPITYGEAGIFRDEHGFYVWEPIATKLQ